MFLSDVALYACPKGFILITGTMLLRKPTTRRSSRVPKLKEPEVGEGSSPGATNQLEFAPRLELVIKTSTEKAFIQPTAFEDTEASTGAKMALPHWGEIFKKISREEFQEHIPHNDPDVRALDN